MKTINRTILLSPNFPIPYYLIASHSPNFRAMSKKHPLYHYAHSPTPIPTPAHSNVLLDVSDISSEEQPQKIMPNHKKPQKQSKLDIFMQRLKSRKELEAQQYQEQRDIITEKMHIKSPSNLLQHKELQKAASFKLPISSMSKNSQEIEKAIKREESGKKQFGPPAVPIYTRKAEQEKQREKIYEEIIRKRQEEKRIKQEKRKEEKRQEKKKKAQAERKRKKAGIDAFINGVIGDGDDNAEKEKISRLDLFNTFEAQKQGNFLMDKASDDKKLGNQNNAGLIYRKMKIEREKIPSSFLKMLLSYKFNSVLAIPESKKIPNVFTDQLMYKKIFHYLVTNQCIADIHGRIVKCEQNKQNTAIPISISDLKRDQNGFIIVSLTQFDRKGAVVSNIKSTEAEMKKAQTSKNDKIEGKDKEKNKGVEKKYLEQQNKQKFMLKNLSLSRNRLGIITNAKNFKIDHYGIPSKKNDHIFGFLCLLVTPESKEDLNGQVKALASFDLNELQMILKINKSHKAFFIDLEKISTHIREYLAITHLYDTEVASFVYNPPLIEQFQFDMIEESDRQLLNPILNTLKEQYNQTQFESIREMVLRESGIVLLQGPPGTGKTTTLMGLLAAQYEYLKNIYTGDGDKRKIMICAPSNAAIDHITKRLVCQGLITHHKSCSSNQMSFQSNHSHSQEHEKNIQFENSEKMRIFPKVLRVGIVESTDPDILKVSLDDICDRQANEVKDKISKRNNMTTTQVKQKIISLSKQINRLSTKKGLSEMDYEYKVNSLRNQIKRYETLLYNFRRDKIQLKQTYSQIQKRLFEEADIILTTLSSSGSQRLERLMGLIGSLIVDEAAQATQTNLLIPFQTGVRKVLLIGDPCQLPATTMSQDSSITLFNRSLFERFLDSGVKPYFLNIQYRMAPLIRQFPSNNFYAGRLKDANRIITRYHPQESQMQDENNQLTPLTPFFNRNSMFLDIKFGRQEFHYNSYRNVGECLTIKNLVIHFIKNTKLSVGVITPYQAQRKYLLKELKKEVVQIIQMQKEVERVKNANENIQALEKEDGECEVQVEVEGEDHGHEAEKNKKKIENKDLEEVLQERVMINTVDSFQGQEKDIIIVSTVRSNHKKEIGFLKDQRRINVALTRSRHLLIVIGNGDTMGSNETWNGFLNWTEEKKSYYMIKSEEQIDQMLGTIQSGPAKERPFRMKYDKLSKDNRKLDREQIQRQDFGLGATRKKVKKDQKNNHIIERKVSEEIPMMKTEKKQQPAKQEQNNHRSKGKDKDLDSHDILDEQKQIKVIHKKRQLENDVAKFEEMNKRMKQTEEKLAKNSGWAQLFK